MITLSDGVKTLSLPADLYWSDEHEWQPVAQAVERTITGAMIIESATRLGGRPITLEPEDDSSAWIALTDLRDLQAWAAIAGQVLTLAMRGATYSVIFRHHDESGVSAKPVVHYNAPDTADFYLATIRLMEI